MTKLLTFIGWLLTSLAILVAAASIIYAINYVTMADNLNKPDTLQLETK